MDEFNKPFSSMTKGELYEVLRQFKQDLIAQTQRQTTLNLLLARAETQTDGLEERLHLISDASEQVGPIHAALKESQIYHQQIKEISRVSKEKENLILNLHTRSGRQAAEIEKAHKEIKIYGVVVRDHSRDASRLKQKFEEMNRTQRREHSQTNEEQQNEFETMKNRISELTQQVESLIPKAALGSLVSSFYESKLRYGDENSNKQELIFHKFLYSRNLYINIALYLGFVGTLLCVVALLISPFVHLSPFSIAIPDNLAISFQATLSRFLLSTPLLWLAFHLNKAINERAVLYEEYNYKQRLTTTYMGFIREYPDEEVKVQFTRELLKHINKPPSITKKRFIQRVFLTSFQSFPLINLLRTVVCRLHQCRIRLGRWPRIVLHKVN